MAVADDRLIRSLVRSSAGDGGARCRFQKEVQVNISVQDASEDQTCVIIGASHAGGQLAGQLRRAGWQGQIVLVGDEPLAPYHRPPLSKQFITSAAEPDSLLLRPESFYEEHGIDLRLNARAESLDTANRTIVLSTGEALRYDRLALCTGARVRRLALGDGLEGVHYLRSVSDAMAVRRDLENARNAVVIGGGYVGLEAAATLRQSGLEVTLIERTERVLNRVAGAQLSGYMHELHRAHGVHIVLESDVVAINGKGRVESVTCTNGEQFPADLVIIGIGIVPETQLAQGAGLRIENGIWVDEFCRTSDPYIYAAGDCTSHPSALYGRQLRLESVQNANDQARIAAITISGGKESYQTVPWFWSDQYDIKLQTAGLSAGYDRAEVDGSLAADSTGFAIRYYRDGQLIAGDCVNRPRDFMEMRRELASLYSSA